jgi:ATP-dependent RNA helicase DDX24/MAK5
MKRKWNKIKLNEDAANATEHQAVDDHGNLLNAEDLNELEWKQADIFDGNREFMPIVEELDGYGVVYEGSKGGKMVKFQKLLSGKAGKAAVNNKPKEQKAPKKSPKPVEAEDKNDLSSIDVLQNDMSEWNTFELDARMIKALDDMGFTKPTKIQEEVLPVAIVQGKDVVGVSETGSGKSLAFCLPILSHFLKHDDKDYDYLPALILTPTRELASQIQKHLSNVTKYTNIRSISIFGGMSPEKQERMLNKKPHIIIATPGRFMQWISEGCHEYLSDMTQLQFLVIDEADRMVERGHFKDLEHIFARMTKHEVVKEWNEDDLGLASATTTSASKPSKNFKRQTMIFSATIKTDQGELKQLMDSVPFARDSFEVIDLTTKKILAAKLIEYKVDCLQTDKDGYLLYLIKNTEGRKLIFANSIDCVRRLLDMLRLLKVPVLGLHAQMQQKSRLEHLEKFAARDYGVLVASDVAARGLDIPNVDLVIHYQLPKTKDLYVHRSGRTARAQKDGLAVMFCAPEERKTFHKLLKELKKDNVPSYPVTLKEVEHFKKITHLSAKISKLEYQHRKTRKNQNWMKKIADEMDLIIDDELVEDEDHGTYVKRQNELNRLKGDLNAMLV